MPSFQNLSLVKKPNYRVPTEPSSVVNEKLPLSSPRTFVADQLKNTVIPEREVGKTARAENPEADKPIDVAVDAEKVTRP
ncbi:hypothetical protein Hanom_Chr04g00322281 [Helianthus anomalus]